MADKAGDRFTDSRGIQYELRPDTKGGHLRPHTLPSGSGRDWFAEVAAAVLTSIILHGITAGAKHLWRTAGGK